FFELLPPPPSSTLFPYTTLFRSLGQYEAVASRIGHDKHTLPGMNTCLAQEPGRNADARRPGGGESRAVPSAGWGKESGPVECLVDRKSTRLNSSHRTISYAVFCL